MSVLPRAREEKGALSSFRSIAEKIRVMEDEKRNLLLEIEELKKLAESKTRALESEVGMLREEVESLRTLLGGEEAKSGKTPEEPPPPPMTDEPEKEKTKLNLFKRKR